MSEKVREIGGPRGGMRGMKGGPRAANPVKSLKRLLKYLFHSYWLSFIFVVIAIVFSAIVGVAGNLFLKSLIDSYIMPFLKQKQENNVDYSPLIRALLTMAVLYYLGVAATYAYNKIMIYVSNGTLNRIRDDMFTHMESLPIRYFDTHSHGDIMSCYTNDTDTLRQMVGQSIPHLISAGITVVTTFISMVVLSPVLTALVILSILVMGQVTKIVGGKSAVYFREQQKNLGAVNGYIEEMINGQKVVKVFCHEEEAKAKFEKLNQSLYESADHANTMAFILMPVMSNLGNINYVLTLALGAIMAISGFGGMTLGTLASFLQLSRSFNMPVTQISQQFNSIIMALAGAERIFALLDEKPEEDEGYVTLVNAKEDGQGQLVESESRTGLWAWKYRHGDGGVTYQKLEGDVIFDGVDFGYTDEKIVLHDIRLYAKPGQKVAFVGATGAGKTTITNLINRFYDIQDGKIRYDGININKISKSDLRRSLGMVLQDTHLFTGSVMENIRFGRLEASDEEVIAAAKLANAHDFICKLPDGYDTVLSGNGASLSQGQRQLLSIARAAIADPPVLILDEATSSIDTRTERIIQEGMDHLMEGRTVFVIAHRLSTVQNSNVIMVLDQGRIIERGSHDELIDQKGKYYQLYTGAFELS